MPKEKTSLFLEYQEIKVWFWILCLCFCIGAISGVWIASKPILVEKYNLTTAASLDLFGVAGKQVLSCMGIYMAAFFASCSLLAPVLIPSVSICYGFTYGFSVFFYLSGRGAFPGGLILALIPKLLVGVPIFLIAAAAGLRFSFAMIGKLSAGESDFRLGAKVGKLCVWFFCGVAISSGMTALGAFLAKLI